MLNPLLCFSLKHPPPLLNDSFGSSFCGQIYT
jgi:hypothetical protein